MKISDQKGFTLIEMSIVLVIIGLIVGGILKGQELIESAREKNIITQLDQVRAAINTFEDKYQSFPGDFGDAVAFIAPGAGDGNDNGVVGAAITLANSNTDDMNTNEHIFFWNQLLAADLIGGGVASTAYTAGTATAVTAFGTAALPEIALPSAGLTMGYIAHTGDSNTAADNRTSHWVRINGFDSDPAPTAFFTPVQAAQLDIKTDDGIAYQGTTRTALTGSGCGDGGEDPAEDYEAQGGQEADTCFPLIELSR